MEAAVAKPPATVTVGPYTYDLVMDEPAIDRVSVGDGEDLWGRYQPSSGRILIRPGLPPDLERVSVLHELLHACIEVAGRPCDDDKGEERIVAAVAPALLDVLLRNKPLTTYLLSDG